MHTPRSPPRGHSGLAVAKAFPLLSVEAHKGYTLTILGINDFSVSKLFRRRLGQLQHLPRRKQSHLFGPRAHRPTHVADEPTTPSAPTAYLDNLL